MDIISSNTLIISYHISHSQYLYESLHGLYILQGVPYPSTRFSYGVNGVSLSRTSTCERRAGAVWPGSGRVNNPDTCHFLKRNDACASLRGASSLVLNSIDVFSKRGRHLVCSYDFNSNLNKYIMRIVIILKPILLYVM